MQRNVLRTYSGALSTVCTSASDMECTDDMEHVFFKGIRSGFLGNTRLRIIENALFTSTCRADIPTGIAADTLGKFVSPECKPFIRCHCFQFCNLVKSTAIRIYFPVFAHHFIIGNNFLALAGHAAFCNDICLLELQIAIECGNSNLIAVCGDTGYPFCTLCTQLAFIDLAITWNTDDINLFPINPVFGQQLVKTVRITWLQEYQCFAVFLGESNQILGKIACTKIIVYKIAQCFC